MSGKLAARQNDMTMKGGKIVQGLAGALITPDNTVAWRGEYDEWENQLGQENPDHLEQLIRLPRQQYDEEINAICYYIYNVNSIILHIWWQNG